MPHVTLPTRMLILAAVLAAPGCERGATPDASTGDAPRAALPAPALYERSLVFVGHGDEPVGAVLDFSVLDSGSVVVRTVRGWLGGEAWTSVAEEAWRMEPMRDPWRIVPHGPLRLVAGDDQRIEKLILEREVAPLRLAPGADLAAATPSPTLDYILRRARLGIGGEEHTGVLLDVQRVRALADTIAARGGDEAIVLTGDADEAVVLVGGQATWIPRDGRSRTVEGVQLIPAGPARWRITTPRGILVGELAVVAGAAGPAPRAVRGWIERAGRRSPVSGVMLTREPA